MLLPKSKPNEPVRYLDPDEAKAFLIMIFEHLQDWPIKSADAFRNAILGKNVMAINPLLAAGNEDTLEYLKAVIKHIVAEGRMVDFGFLPNELMKEESIRSRKMFESGEFQHPYDNWLAIASWEGGMCGYLFLPHPTFKNQTLCVELYGVSVPHYHDAILIYDIISIEVRGIGDTVVHPSPMLTDPKFGKLSADEEEAQYLRGANTLDPLVTMLRILADASIRIEDHPAPVKLNKKRAKAGHFEIPAHTVVHTRDYVTAFRAAQAGHVGKGTHASPIAHWRRAHKRHLADGRIVPVRSSKVNWRETEELHRLFYRMPS